MGLTERQRTRWHEEGRVLKGTGIKTIARWLEVGRVLSGTGRKTYIS